MYECNIITHDYGNIPYSYLPDIQQPLFLTTPTGEHSLLCSNKSTATHTPNLCSMLFIHKSFGLGLYVFLVKNKTSYALFSWCSSSHA